MFMEILEHMGRYKQRLLNNLTIQTKAPLSGAYFEMVFTMEHLQFFSF